MVPPHFPPIWTALLLVAMAMVLFVRTLFARTILVKGLLISARTVCCRGCVLHIGLHLVRVKVCIILLLIRRAHFSVPI